ncbi:MAG: hypothetical protein HYW65_04140 [Candidatus Liptonbacteria bacterium]|nr:hypothetical protein [Candidatus Liptonbacteria bacterium]
MASKTYKNYDDKVRRVEEIIRQKAELDVELRSLLAPVQQVDLPVGFSWNDEVLKVIQEAGEGGIDVRRILRILQQKHPTYDADRKRVASALAYLKNDKKKIAKIGHGVYKILENKNP